MIITIWRVLYTTFDSSAWWVKYYAAPKIKYCQGFANRFYGSWFKYGVDLSWDDWKFYLLLKVPIFTGLKSSLCFCSLWFVSLRLCLFVFAFLCLCVCVSLCLHIYVCKISCWPVCVSVCGLWQFTYLRMPPLPLPTRVNLISPTHFCSLPTSLHGWPLTTG